MLPNRTHNDPTALVAARIQQLQTTKQPLLVSIDGRSTSGKTTLAAALSEVLDCNIVHMDQFYLHPDQRTPERYATPGGNVDHEEVLRNVIVPWQESGTFSYAPYDAHSDTYLERLFFPSKPVTIIEGSYSGHPRLWDAYDLHVFMTTTPERQRQRVLERNGASALGSFLTKWIPLEEAYFDACQIPERSDISIET